LKVTCVIDPTEPAKGGSGLPKGSVSIPLTAFESGPHFCDSLQALTVTEYVVPLTKPPIDSVTVCPLEPGAFQDPFTAPDPPVIV
jgi:hypothetical protein